MSSNKSQLSSSGVKLVFSIKTASEHMLASESTSLSYNAI